MVGHVVDAVRKAPLGIALLGFIVAIPIVVYLFLHSLGKDDAVSTPTPDVEVAVTVDSLPTPLPLPTLIQTVPIATETPRVVASHTPAEIGADPPVAPLPTLTQVFLWYATEAPVVTAADMPADMSLIELPGDEENVPIVMIDPVRQEDLGAYPNVQIPTGVVGSSELYVAHGDIYGTGRCFVHVFRPGDRVTGLSSATWRLVRISSGAPEQREDLVQQIQLAAAWDPAAGGSCPFD